MEVMYKRCAGLDVHKKVVVVTIIVLGENGRMAKETRSFETTTNSLLALSDWLMANGVSHVAMESTGDYTPPTMLPIVGDIL